jgi:drug/metabolite transporter (DMT)-like permease
VHEGRLRAIAIMIAAVAVFAFMDAILKVLAARYPPMQVAALRGATSLPCTLLPMLLGGRLRELRPRRWPMHLLRGALSVVVLGGFIYSLRALSLANTYSVFLSAPLIVAALSVPLLGERVDRRTWIAILVGLAGVLTMLRPSTSGMSTFGALAALAGAIAYALSAIAVRVLTRTDTTVSVVFWTVGLMTLFTSAISAPGWVPIGHDHWKWLLGLGLLAATAQYLLTEAFRSAPPSVVTPFAVIDRVVWHVLPSARVCFGGGIVIVSGLYLIWHQRRQSEAETAREPWQGATEKGRMLRPRATVAVVARKQEEDAP